MRAVNFELESLDSLIGKASNHASPSLKRYYSYNLQLIPSNSFRLSIQSKQTQQTSNPHKESSVSIQPSHTIIAEYRDQNMMNSRCSPEEKCSQLSDCNTQKNTNSTCFSDLLEHPRFLFYVLFATNIIFPTHKSYRSLVKRKLSSFGLAACWTKANQFCIAQVKLQEENQYCPVICNQDILQHENEGIWKNSGMEYIQKVRSIKQKNAFRTCFKYFKEHLVNKLYEVHEDQIGCEYESLLRTISSDYMKWSCHDRLAQVDPYHKESTMSKNDELYSLKALKQKIQTFLTDHRQFSFQSTCQLNNSLNAQELSQLFCTQYESVLKQNQSMSEDHQFVQSLYSATLNRMKKYMPISQTSIILMEISIAHFFSLHSSKVLNVSKFSLSDSSRLVSMEQQSRSYQLLLSPSSIHSQMGAKSSIPSQQADDLRSQIHELKQVINKNKTTVPAEISQSSNVNFFIKKSTAKQSEECLINLSNGVKKMVNKSIPNKKRENDKYLQIKIEQLKQETQRGFSSNKKYMNISHEQNYLIMQGQQNVYQSSLSAYLKEDRRIPQTRKNIKCNESKQNVSSVHKQRAKSEADMSNLAHNRHVKPKQNISIAQMSNRSGSKNQGSQKSLWRF